MTDLERTLVEIIDREQEDWLAFLGELVNCDSGTYNKDEADRCGQLLADAIGRGGFEVERIPQVEYGDHVLARKPGRGDRRLLFIGHFDTVWPRGTVAQRPFTIDGDRATGPGVYDMKGGLVVLLAALSALRQAGAPVWDDVTMTVIFNSDEEILSPTSKAMIIEESQRADTACVLEPARMGGEYTFVRKGAGRYTYTVHGRGAHSGLRFQDGRSAIEELAHKIVALRQLSNPETGTSVNVGVVRGGERFNVVAPLAECEFDLRAFTLEEAEQMERQFAEIASRQHVPDTTCEFRGGMLFPPVPYQERNALLFSWIQDAGRRLGLELTSTISSGGSDGNLAGQYAPLIDGMGVCGHHAHSEEEYMIVSSLAERAKVLALFLTLWPERVAQLDAYRS